MLIKSKRGKKKRHRSLSERGQRHTSPRVDSRAWLCRRFRRPQGAGTPSKARGAVRAPDPGLAGGRWTAAADGSVARLSRGDPWGSLPAARLST